jgi:nucleotide-binding universal stress UspA family protein
MAEIIVGVDGSPNSLAALGWAHEHALRRGDHVVALFAWGFVPPGHAGDGHTFDPGYGADEAAAALAAAVEAVVGPGHSAGIERRVECGVASSALLGAAAAADLLVVGARGVGGLRGLLLGSVSRQCLHHTTGPLAIVPGGAAKPARSGRRRIVVGVDGSAGSDRALDWAISEARSRGAPLEVVHVWEVAYPALGPAIGFAAEYGAVEEEAQVLLDKVVAGHDTSGLTSPVARRLLPGPAASALLGAARGAEELVVGSRGQGGFAGLLLGSVTQQVAHHATCPIVVVP